MPNTGLDRAMRGLELYDIRMYCRFYLADHPDEVTALLAAQARNAAWIATLRATPAEIPLETLRAAMRSRRKS